jgi:sulfite reductase (NADPH) hemoprotein beta-component
MNAPIDPSSLPAHLRAGIYRYDAVDRAFLRARADEFREQVARRLAGGLTEDEFKPLRLMNGLYLQLHAYMLRIAIPYGVLSSVQLRQLAHIARTYDRGYGHFTTRQNLQLNWISLADAPAALDALADADLHAIQTSGNCIRNVTIDEYAGVARDEVEDPRVTAEILRQWSTLHPEFSYLPRKFKIAITGSSEDRAAVEVHDIGLTILKDGAGEIGYRVHVGGGLGRAPIIGTVIADFVPQAKLIAYLEAILRVYNANGGRENIHKARIKFLVRDLGIAAFRALVEEELAAMKLENYIVTPEHVGGIAARFAPPALLPLADSVVTDPDPDFAVWQARNTHPNKAPGYVSVVVSLKPTGGIPGDITSDQMEAVADLADAYSLSELRVTHIQNLVLPHVRQTDLPSVWRGLRDLGLATPNIGLLSDIIACPGLDYCSLANARSIPIAQAITTRFKDLRRQHDIGQLTLNISGCINACAHHHVGNIGILGVDRQGEEYYQLTLGGSASNDATLGDITGPSFSADRVVDAIETIVATYLALRAPGETFLEAYRRLGLAPFKDALYAPA